MSDKPKSRFPFLLLLAIIIGLFVLSPLLGPVWREYDFVRLAMFADKITDTDRILGTYLGCISAASSQRAYSLSRIKHIKPKGIILKLAHKK